jgi:CheY-like chemotaxis protein
MKLPEITSAMLAQAMAVYLRHAYQERQPPEHVQELADVDPEAPLTQAFERDEVIKFEAPDRPGFIQQYRWRLGNDRYPHMQLGLDRCSDADDFVFIVDTHDRNFPLGSPAVQDPEFHKLLKRNERLKHAIEGDWAAAGLPTLHGHISSRLRNECDVSGGRRKTVLIVDDDESVLELEEALVQQAGYRVLTATGGLEALAQIDGNVTIDLCLLDIMMPAMDGLAVARKARRRVGSDFPIVYVTALPPERAQDGVADDYVRKPFDPDHLIDVIRRHIG